MWSCHNCKLLTTCQQRVKHSHTKNLSCVKNSPSRFSVFLTSSSSTVCMKFNDLILTLRYRVSTFRDNDFNIEQCFKLCCDSILNRFRDFRVFMNRIEISEKFIFCRTIKGDSFEFMNRNENFENFSLFKHDNAWWW